LRPLEWITAPKASATGSDAEGDGATPTAKGEARKHPQGIVRVPKPGDAIVDRDGKAKGKGGKDKGGKGKGGKDKGKGKGKGRRGKRGRGKGNANTNFWPGKGGAQRSGAVAKNAG